MLSDIRNNFLILGFTGPLRSGCSTAANFFLKLLHQEAGQYLKLPDQDAIERLYEELSFMIKSNVAEHLVLDKRKTLVNLLRRREIRKTLKEEKLRSFYSISMSEMLLKYSIEYLLNNPDLRGDLKYQKIIDLIRSEAFDRAEILKINDKIAEKKYRSITPEECAFYDNYLLKIAKLMETLKKDNPEVIGDVLQDFGDNIRCHGNPFTSEGILKQSNVTLIAAEANRIIKFMRNRQDNDEKRRHHFVIECFRNPFEVEYFRYRYYEFYLFSIFAEKVARKSRENFSDVRDERDRGESKKLEDIHKQDVTRCVYLSDIAVNNNSTSADFYNKLLSYYALILRPGCVNATSDESFMNQAYSLSLRSSCISRQVGAIVTGKIGYVVGAGWNDAGEGQIGCGYRQVADIKNLNNDVLVISKEKDTDFRRFIMARNSNIEDSFCFKDEYSLFDIRKKLKRFMKDRSSAFKNLGAKQLQQQLIGEWLEKDIRVKRLEYCRALHAEENALLQASKIGGVGARGGKIYTTSFPCELCAKKIYQSGIKEVVYTEPYPESISQDVFLRDGVKRIILTQFEGVKSHSYYRLYKASADKKEWQILKLMDVD